MDRHRWREEVSGCYKRSAQEVCGWSPGSWLSSRGRRVAVSERGGFQSFGNASFVMNSWTWALSVLFAETPVISFSDIGAIVAVTLLQARIRVAFGVLFPLTRYTIWFCRGCLSAVSYSVFPCEIIYCGDRFNPLWVDVLKIYLPLERKRKELWSRANIANVCLCFRLTACMCRYE